ncbi:MAG: IclR family transcriptional regulator [Rubrobacteraceae bacterium]
MAKRVASSPSSPGGVQSLERALDVLELLGQSNGELGVTEIAPAAGLANGTAHRLLTTLVRRGYARQNPENRRYTLGIKAYTLSAAAREHLGSMAWPFLAELTEVSQESSNLAALEKNSVVYLNQVPAPRMVRMFTEPGNRSPLHSTGTGKVLLAYQPAEIVDHVIDECGLPRFTDYTITDRKQLQGELDRIRERGYALDTEEMEEGVRCLACPVFAPDGRIIAAMSISGPAGRLDESRLEELIPHIQRISEAFSEDLGASA